ncbi:sensor domain-containing diguanylate cyclase [Colwellia sp. M166]|uniref:sensor domain-containing diguanylate cyclase n=1 Tax=Colwellia sp. M166 TaxID=2583805 RepID=UPI00211F0107|nr:sensor domain-containing diguanylate cyclase [Colwellia sp. M166]UUO24068.1 sensor domain-containing diguanylate cyclase [Colwellia sp. M166]|tara:strand:+ start:18412 stop:19434 length:1023 start_codon:yes stop_codon:yes gene_type:complete
MSHIQQLIENSKANEDIARKLFEIETEILACQSSEELLQRLLDLIQVKFQLSSISLLLAEPTPLSYLINGNLQSHWHKKYTKQISVEKLTLLHSNKKPFLSNQLKQLDNIIPAALLADAKSVALTPLSLEGKLFGSLLFTDKASARFHHKLGTFHLEQLAVKVSLCLSNVLIREQLQYMAHYDRLTGAANRRLMEVCLGEELIRQRRYGVPFSVLFIDCNKFKAINDTYGHGCGDKVLTYVASQLQELVRENDKCFRYAGDEFVVVLASQTLPEAEQAGERLCQFFNSNPMRYQDIRLPISISCGAAESDGKQTMDELLRAADKRLYANKKASNGMVFKL